MANTKEQISRNMRSNKGKDTKPELLLRKELWRRGLRYRKNYKGLYGKPDIVFLKAKIAVFVDGKMWHGYDWEHRKNDFKSNRDYWIPKIEQNIEHDYEVNRNLLGPFHTEEQENVAVGPHTFERLGTWKNGKSEYVKDYYAFVKTIV